MKKIIIVLASLAMAVSSFAATELPSDRTITKDYDLKGFSGIVASGIYDVQLTKSESWGVSLSFPEVLEDYIVVRVSNGKLYLSMKQVPMKISKNYKNWTVKACVGMPVFESLDLSGAAKFQCDDTFDIGDREFKLDVSGASKVNGLSIVAKELEMEMSGASFARVNGDFINVEIEMGGAAKCEFEISADYMNQEISGAAKAYHTGEFDRIEVEASGAALFSFTGLANKMDFEVSGAAKLESSKARVNDVKASVSGASYCEVNAQDNLRVDCSGASSLRYVDHDNLKLDIRSINRGSSITKMK